MNAIEKQNAPRRTDKRGPETDTISTRTLKAMDKAVSNYNMGKVSPPIDLSDFKTDDA